MPRFLLTITDTITGDRAALNPGGRGERDLIEDVVEATLEQGVGFLKTEAQVEEALRKALHTVIGGLKREVKAPSSRMAR
jgi:hypothetical protein